MKKRILSMVLTMSLAFSMIATSVLAADGHVHDETCGYNDGQCVYELCETEEDGNLTEAEADGEIEISTEEVTELQENPDTEIPEETEKATEEPSSEEDTEMSLESEETTSLLGSSFSVAETETDEESEALCDHGNDAESCPVCDLEEQIAALPDLDEIQTMTGNEEEALYTQASTLADIYYDDLTVDEQDQVSNIDTLWDILDYFSSGLMLTALSEDTSWYNSTSTSFTITTASQLAGLASLVNAGNDFSGKTIKLGNSINLNSESWTSIGTTSNPFKGTFDGQGYTVQNLSVSGESTYAGLFGYADGSAVIKSVTVTGSVTGTDYVGGIVGRISSGVTVEGCTNSAEVSIISSRFSTTQVGGIVGRNLEGTISNCINTGKVSGVSSSYAGGITGRSSGTISNCYNTGEVNNSNSGNGTGGVVGYCNGGTISNCYNIGTISGLNYVGGVFGLADGTLSNNYYLSDTSNTATDQTAKTAAQFASGEVTYLLNGSVSGGTTWYQTIGTDSYPVLSSSSGKVYYGTNCAGTAIYSNSTVPAASHSYEAVVTDPTCTEKGYTTYTCSVCGDSYTANETEATGHSWNEGTVTKAATCTEDGEKTYTCTVCGETKTETIEKTGHSYEAVVTDPTCTAGGYTTYTCSVCGDSYTADETDATGHSYEAVVTDPTCTAGGYTTYTCSACGDSYTADETEATGHSWNEGTVTKAATCTEDGEKTYTCTVCGETKTEKIEATGHSYEAVVTDPTCTEKGYTTYTCSVCGDSYTADETEAKGHSWDEGTVTTAATCTEDGVKTYTCSVCGETKTETIEKTGHSYEAVVTEPTCTAGGYTTYTCSACGDSYTADETEATGHNYEAVITKATYTAQGYTTYTCTVCGESYEADYTAVKVIDGTDGNLSTKTTVQELTAVPDGLKNLYSSVDALVSDLIKRVIAVGTGYTEDNALVYDVVLQYSTDGGKTWITATVDNFPADGITVTLPYPDGTDASYEFTVLHMFTVDSDRLGITAGDTESPNVTKTDDGLVFTLTGLSPVAVSWKAVTTSTTETDTSSQTDITTESTDTSGTSASSTTSAQTGDNSQMMLWLVLLLVSGVGAVGIAVYNTKRRRSR